jgi:ATP-binding cassette subfamily G (WHITE) protein 2 (PDR)
MSSTTLDENKQQTNVEVASIAWTESFKSHLDILQANGIAIKQAGFSFRDLSVCGRQSSLATQANVGSILTAPFRPQEYLNLKSRSPRKILDSFDGFLDPGELLLVLGRPGAGCSTFLKTISGEMSGLELVEGSSINYSGISLVILHPHIRSTY